MPHTEEMTLCLSNSPHLYRYNWAEMELTLPLSYVDKVNVFKSPKPYYVDL